jgi:hypothetical protein
VNSTASLWSRRTLRLCTALRHERLPFDKSHSAVVSSKALYRPGTLRCSITTSAPGLYETGRTLWLKQTPTSIKLSIALLLSQLCSIAVSTSSLAEAEACRPVVSRTSETRHAVGTYSSTFPDPPCATQSLRTEAWSRTPSALTTL